MCTEVHTNTDKAGSNDFSRLTFNLKESDQSILGVVSVHFRHTTRRVQVQGSATMPDGSKAAVWFTENVLSERFKQLAKSKQFDITSFNDKVLEMSRLHHQSLKSAKYCSQCGKLFSNQSKPSQCIGCKNFVHRGCSKVHTSACMPEKTQERRLLLHLPSLSRTEKRLRLDDNDHDQLTPEILPGSTPNQPSSSTATTALQDSISSITSAVSSNTASTFPPTSQHLLPPRTYLGSLSTNLINSGIPTFTGASTAASFVPDATSTLQSSAANTIPTQSSSQLNFVRSTPSQVTQTLSSRQSPPIPLSQPTAAPQLAQLPRNPTIQANPSSKSKKKNRIDPNISPEAAQVEYLTTELNFTHTKIVQQDSTIKDLEFKVKILSEKLRISEEKLNLDLHRAYLGESHGRPPPHATHPVPHTGQCQGTCYHPCTSHPPLLTSHHCPQHVSCASVKPTTKSDNLLDNIDIANISKDLKEDINVLKLEILQLKAKVDSFTSLPKPYSPQLEPDTHEDIQPSRANIVQVVAEVHNSNTSSQDISVVSIEEEIPEAVNHIYVDNNPKN